jgi:hypothetical protein
MIAFKDGRAGTVDSLIISPIKPLSEVSLDKIKRNEGDENVMTCISDRYGIPCSAISTVAATITWRGIWAPGAVQNLLRIGKSNQMI